MLTVDNRVALRELEAINRLIDFIGHPEWNDLHVYAVMVISNCLEDVESVEVNKYTIIICTQFNSIYLNISLKMTQKYGVIISSFMSE